MKILKLLRKIAELSDGLFLLFSLYMAFSFLTKAQYMESAVWFIAHGVWCCSMSLVELRESATGIDLVTKQPIQK